MRAMETLRALAGALTEEGAPFLPRDKVVVPLLTAISLLAEGAQPEAIASSFLVAFAVLVFTLGVQGCFGIGKRRALSFFAAAVLLVLGGAGFEHLKTPFVPQADYGRVTLAEASSWKTPKLLASDIVCDGEFFRDANGRVVFLRGVNLAGETKVPTRPRSGATFDKTDFFDWKGVSFVGRPFEMEEADEHLARLRSWGFTFLRLLVTWEAIEHDGPGVYDIEYLEYIRKVIQKCAEYDISVFIDPHQDVWSRWTGGDGAPAWTLEKVGFKLENLYDSGATITHQQYGDPFPKMVWGTNYNRLAAATMFTLFFGGDLYAPKAKIDGVPAQQYLQDHYINAIVKLAEYVKNESNVLGYDTLNEPSSGFIGLKDLDTALFPAPLGWYLTAFQSMRLGSGESVNASVFEHPTIFSRIETLNLKKVSAWQSEKNDIWRNEGIFEPSRDGKHAKVLRSDHFAKNANGEEVNFVDDFMAPFFMKFKKAIRKVHPNTIIFAEGYINPNKPLHHYAPKDMEVDDKTAWAPHYYDGMTLVLKKARPWIALDLEMEFPVVSSWASYRAISRNLAHVKKSGESFGGKGVPVLVGETGIPMDLDRGDDRIAAAYKDGDYSSQIHALDRTMKGLESNFLSFTIWNYSPANNHKRGDLWNDEDLSLWSKDDKKLSEEIDINSGGRALEAAARPYPMRTCGVPLELSFDPISPDRPFTYKFADDDKCSGEETVFFVPKFQYPRSFNFTISDGSLKIHEDSQIVSYKPKTSGTHTISFTSK